MYNLLDYGVMMNDEKRMQAYCKALKQAVTPDSVVLDIGTGTGIFALLACQYGARKVYAIEPDPMIDIARQFAETNQYADRIIFFNGLSVEIDIPDKADIIISDLRGRMPLFKQHLPSIIDARNRLLAPDGTLIPARDHLMAAPVCAPRHYDRVSRPWEKNEFDLDLTGVSVIAKNNMLGLKVENEQLAAVPGCWHVIDYYQVENSSAVGSIEWEFQDQSTLHGYRVWFDAELAPGIGFSNSPLLPELVYSSLFFPLLQPLDLEQGDKLTLELKADLVGEDYIWRWNTRHFAKSRDGRIVAEFSQSTFNGVPLTSSEMYKRSAEYKPVLKKNGHVDHKIMSMLQEGIPLGEVATRLAASYPEKFPVWEKALAYVGELSSKYCE